MLTGALPQRSHLVRRDLPWLGARMLPSRMAPAV